MGVSKRIAAGGGEKPKRLYAYLDGVIDALAESPRSRTALHLDAVDADAFDSDPDAIEDEQNLFLVRVVTTPSKLEKLAGRLFKESDWITLTLEPERNMPATWVMPATGGAFGGPVRTNTTSIEYVEPDGDLAGRLRAACSAPEAERTEAPDALQLATALLPTSRLRVVALDVGQASCVALYDGRRCVGYFDVGAPVYFNQKSYPTKIDHIPATSGFVILSHWDFDHYALAYKEKVLETLDWYAPDQPVGPRTAKFQRDLGHRLHFISGNLNASGAALLQQCTGPPSDRNSSGYALRLQLGNQAVLLTGDADYGFVPPNLQADLTAVLVPHHGGSGTGPPPTPTAFNSPMAVASYGLPNRYRHPCEDRLRDHKRAGWNVRATAKRGVGLPQPRGNRILFPL